MIAKVMHDLDIRLLARIFIPAANWIDENWHINPWQLAAKIMIASTVLAMFDLFVRPGRGIVWPAFLAIIILLLRGFEIWKLSKISDDYERSPDVMPVGWLYFNVPFSRIWHMIWGFGITIPSALMGGIMFHHGVTNFIIYFVPQLWFPLAGVGYYFAGVLRPPGKRKQKKVRIPFGAILAGVKS